jgi:hypothetical protein
VIVQLLLLLIPSLAGFGGTERVVGFSSGLLVAPDPMALLALFYLVGVAWRSFA